MRKFNTKRFLALTLATVMALGSSMTALADAPTTNAATANVLAYSVDTVVVPTALKVALNPSGLSFTPGYDKATGVDGDNFEDGTYYTESSGTYTKATAYVEGTTYYTARTAVTDQVISLNYGIANKATDDKVVSVTLAVSQGDVSTNPIVFVDSEADVTAAKSGEFKIYLEATPADDQPTAKTYTYTKHSGAFTTGTTYYTRSGDSFTATSDGSPVTGTTYYTQESATAIGIAIQASELADVTMDKATAGIALKSSTDTKSAEGTISFKLGEAEYGLKDGQVIDFTTTKTDLESKLEMTNLGDSTAFTISGKLNTNADWTKAGASAVTITPTYKIADVDGNEADVTTGFKQVSTLEDQQTAAKAEIDALVEAEDYDTVPTAVQTAVNAAYDAIEACTAVTGDDGLTAVLAAQKDLVNAAISGAENAEPSIATTTYALTAGTELSIPVTLGAGDLAAENVTSVKYGDFECLSQYATYESNTVKVKADTVDFIIADSATTDPKLVITFDDEDETSVTVTLTRP